MSFPFARLVKVMQQYVEGLTNFLEVQTACLRDFSPLNQFYLLILSLDKTFDGRAELVVRFPLGL